MPTTSASGLQVVPKASVELFGLLPDGRPVHRVVLACTAGAVTTYAAVITRGATVQAVVVPDKDGKLEDVVLGFDDLAGYHEGANFCYGGTPGRFANRIANGKFKLEGQEVQVTTNWKGASGTAHCLHGGNGGFDSKVWDIAKGPWVDAEGAHVVLQLTSPAGEEGFPGQLTAQCLYSWKVVGGNHTLEINWSATTDRPTVVNLTNHSYFNLCGVEKASQVLDSHTVQLMCDKWTEVNEDAIPTGNLLDVAGTAMDFLTPKKVGADLAGTPNGGFGYDHNFVVSGVAAAPGLERQVGIVTCTSGRRMECWATQPGVQLFSMQPKEVFDMATKGKYGQTYPVHGGLALETQHFPDSPNQPGFPSTVLAHGQTYDERCSYRFSVDK